MTAPPDRTTGLSGACLSTISRDDDLLGRPISLKVNTAQSLWADGIIKRGLRVHPTLITDDPIASARLFLTGISPRLKLSASIPFRAPPITAPRAIGEHLPCPAVGVQLIAEAKERLITATIFPTELSKYRERVVGSPSAHISTSLKLDTLKPIGARPSITSARTIGDISIADTGEALFTAEHLSTLFIKARLLYRGRLTERARATPRTQLSAIVVIGAWVGVATRARAVLGASIADTKVRGGAILIRAVFAKVSGPHSRLRGVCGDGRSIAS